MSDISDSLPETDYDRSETEDERFDLPYDEVFLEDGSLIRPMSILDFLVDPVTGDVLNPPVP